MYRYTINSDGSQSKTVGNTKQSDLNVYLCRNDTNLAVLFPNDIVVEQADFIEPWSLAWIGIKGIKVDSYFKMLGITSTQPFIDKCAFDDVLNNIMEIIRIGEADCLSFELRRNAYVNRIFSDLFMLSSESDAKNKIICTQDDYIKMQFDLWKYIMQKK